MKDKQVIELTAQDLLHAVAVWIRIEKPDLYKRYEKISGKVLPLTFELYNETEPKASEEQPQRLVEESKDKTEHKTLRLIRVDTENAKEEEK